MTARPRMALETEALAAVAIHLHQQRVKLYPAAILAGKITADDAAARIRVMAAIVHDWRAKLAFCPPPVETDPAGWRRWLTRDPPPPAEATCAEKVATLEKAHARLAAEGAARTDDYADCVAALLWWHQPCWTIPEEEPVSRLAWTLDLSHALRAEAAARSAPAALAA